MACFFDFIDRLLEVCRAGDLTNLPLVCVCVECREYIITVKIRNSTSKRKYWKLSTLITKSTAEIFLLLISWPAYVTNLQDIPNYVEYFQVKINYSDFNRTGFFFKSYSALCALAREVIIIIFQKNIDKISA